MEFGVLTRLRIKFIAINMALAALVLISTFGTVCALNYVVSVNAVNAYLTNTLMRASASATSTTQVKELQQLERPDVDRVDISLSQESDSALGEHAQSATNQSETANTAVPPAASGSLRATENSANSNITANAAATITEKDATLPTIGRTLSEGRILTATFKVLESGIYTTLPAYSTAALPESTLLRANAQVMHNPNDRGYLAEFDLMYEKLSTTGGWFVAYADASSTHAWQPLAVLLGIVGLIALIVFFLINIAFSSWALRPVARSIKQQQQFTADASHELKTPLTVILANLSILRSHPTLTVAEQMQWIESSETEAQRMQRLVNDMLSLARPKSDNRASNTTGQFEPLDISDLVEGEVLQFESVAFERGILLESRIQENVCVKGDAEKLGRMVSTLIDNACKYVEENGLVEVTLEVDAPNALLDAKAVLRVHNTGEPIPAEDITYLFDRFYRADKARTGGQGGYGLGLAIGRQIAREHHGDITVTSDASGTTFTVTLPTTESE